MRVNREKHHLLVLPEDDATRSIAIGFMKCVINQRAMQILPITDGWKKALDEFTNYQVAKMRDFPKRFMILLIDFDTREDRMPYIVKRIPENLRERVFILGVWSEPEQLKKNLGQSFEKIGESLAQACINDDDELWQHELLKHNLKEIERMKPSVKPLLFSP